MCKMTHSLSVKFVLYIFDFFSVYFLVVGFSATLSGRYCISVEKLEHREMVFRNLTPEAPCRYVELHYFRS